MLKWVIIVSAVAVAVIVHALLREKRQEKAEREEAARILNREPDVREVPIRIEISTGGKIKNMKPKEIFALESRENLVAQMSVYLARKSSYGENMPALTEAEKVVYLVIVMESEVHNGGFDQYFFNPSGNYANRVVDALKKVNALRMAAICEKVLTIFGDSFPEDWEKRAEVFDDLCQNDAEALKALRECNDAFFECEENLTELCYEYIMRNRDQFS